MKRITALLLAALMLCALAGCGGGGSSASAAKFGVSTQGDNSILVEAENASADSVGVGTLIVGENQKIVIEADFGEDQQLNCRFALGEFAPGEIPGFVNEVMITGGDSTSFTAELGVYSVEIQPGTDKLTGTAKICVMPDENAQQDTSAAADYSAVTALDAASVEAFCAEAKQAYLDGDWAKISEMAQYPILVGGTSLADKDAFLSYVEGKSVAAVDREEMEVETCTNLFFNGQGICLGAGEIWINDANYMTDAEPLLQIIALNGIE